MFDYEKLGQFYLGKSFDLAGQQVQNDFVMYDARDLTTHAVIVGMTGSGKTGLGVTLLEEAAIDGIPALVIDPKGDMGNLLLSFPRLRPDDFRDWVHKEDANRKGLSLDEYAAQQAETWRNGLAQWDQEPDRIERYRNAAEAVIYTPGSDAGRQLTVLRSLDAPSAAILASSDAMRERITSAVSGLLALLGIDADPIRSREHILLSNILDQAWRAGRSLDMAALIYEIQSPSFKKVGLLDVEQIFPQNDRMALAMSLNNVLASPSFAGWLQGEPLNIQKLLYSPEGKPRLCILSIAHLSDRERMFFVTILLNEVISWMRSQPGTTSLRALLYMDEVFGYLPPTANPPSKLPLLTLLKQARAYGLGLVLATQNPVDLDYKALSNAGTWFLGRLQTERDKLRVLDGLEGASIAAGAKFNRSEIERTLSALGQRVFLLNNVHDEHPVVFQSRWALSFLSGPMTREQISDLMSEQRPTPAGNAPIGQSTARGIAASLAPVGAVASTILAQGSLSSIDERSRRPLLPEAIEQRFAAISRSVSRDVVVHYRPALLGSAKLHFVDTKAGIDLWQDVQRVLQVDDEIRRSPWDEADVLDLHPIAVDRSPCSEASWDELPTSLTKAASYKSYASQFKEFLYRDVRLTLAYCVELNQYSQPGQSEGDFRVALRQDAREKRDLEIARLRSKYQQRIDRLQDAVRTAERRVETEEQQAKDASTSAWVATGTSILGALFGRKKVSVTNIGRAGSAAKAHNRASSRKENVARAQGRLDDTVTKKEDLEQELQEELNTLSERYDVDALTIEPREITPRKSDITVNLVALLWQPWQAESGGALSPAWDQVAE